MVKFLNKYNTVGNVIYTDIGDEPSLTDESFKLECDIDFIISNFVQKGITPPEVQLEYGKQFTSEDFEKSMATVAECKSAFECLPSNEKERFNNSVSNFLDFIANPKNLRESYEKGYINPDSVDLSDVYPEKYKKDIPETTSTNTVEGISLSGKVEGITGVQPVPENPTQS